MDYLWRGMNVFKDRSEVTITCPKYFSPWLEKEVRELGYEPETVFITGVKLNLNVSECIRLNLNLHCASQVLYSLRRFQAETPDDLYEALAAYPWERILPEDGHFSITSNVNHPSINNSMFASLRVKDAIVDRLRMQRGQRPNTGSELSGAVIHLFWKQQFAEVFIDTSGESLGRHGYRKIPGQAPMLEALAAATILATKWDRRSPFVNPMCGSGTLAIEAALLATRRAPGLFRTNYGFMHLQGYDEEVYREEDTKLEDQIIDVPGLRIIATDISRRAVDNARKNAIAAGVADLIDFSVCDFANSEVPENGGGVVFLNPEYGERLGEVEELAETYGRIGDFMKQRCGGYHGYIFTGNPELAKRIGLKASRRVEFYNAKIECRLLEFELYAGTRDKRKLNNPSNE